MSIEFKLAIQEVFIPAGMSKTHTCECGFTWEHGRDGGHICGPYYRECIIELKGMLVRAIKREAELLSELAAVKEREAKDYAELTEKFEKVHVQNVLSANRVAKLECEKAELVAALNGLKEAVEFTPLGIRGIKAVEHARGILSNIFPAASAAHAPAATLTNEGGSAENFSDVSLIDEGNKIASSGAAKEK